MKYNDLINEINNNLDEKIIMCSSKAKLQQQKTRYLRLLDKAYDKYGEQDFHIFSAPGRTEIGGNHTDHQLGCVLAASVNMDIIAIVIKDDNVVEFNSEGFNINSISVNDLDIKKEEYYKSESIIRGTLSRFKQLGYNVGGFKCISDSEVLKGSGVSSSAAFEVLIGTILSHLYNDNKVSSIEIAKIGQYAENVYFNKPCGLMDQMACSVGGFVSINFKDKENPIVNKIDFDFESYNYDLVIVDTKGDHAHLSDEYGLMPNEMKEVAKELGCDYLSQTNVNELLSNVSKVRNIKNDRALLRAFHYFNETKRAVLQANALSDDKFDTFKQLVKESGNSSFKYLQNVTSPSDYKTQNIALALAISEEILHEDGVCRVHGGGLEGTIQALVSKDKTKEYTDVLSSVFGDDSCHILKIRPVGGYKLI